MRDHWWLVWDMGLIAQQKLEGMHAGGEFQGGFGLPCSKMAMLLIGRDRLAGGPGPDHLNGGPGRDHGDGGLGDDSCDLVEVRRRC